MPIGFKQTGKYLGLFGSPAKLDPDVGPGPGQKVGGVGGRLPGRPLVVGVRHVVPGLLGFRSGEMKLTNAR